MVCDSSNTISWIFRVLVSDSLNGFRLTASAEANIISGTLLVRSTISGLLRETALSPHDSASGGGGWCGVVTAEPCIMRLHTVFQ